MKMLKNAIIRNDIGTMVQIVKDSHGKPMALLAIETAFKLKRTNVCLSILELKPRCKYIYERGMHLACRYGNLVVIKYLLDNFDKSVLNINKAAQVASLKGHFEIVEYLVEKVGGINLGNCLPFAAEGNNNELIKYLVNKGADISVKKYASYRIAVKKSNLTAVKLLVGKGADIRADCDYAVKYCIKNNNIPMLICLISVGNTVYNIDPKIVPEIIYQCMIKKYYFVALRLLKHYNVDDPRVKGIECLIDGLNNNLSSKNYNDITIYYD